jgi:hypothetical protein
MGYAIALKVSMRTIHDPSAAMYSPADQSVEEFCKQQELFRTHFLTSANQFGHRVRNGLTSDAGHFPEGAFLRFRSGEQRA